MLDSFARTTLTGAGDNPLVATVTQISGRLRAGLGSATGRWFVLAALIFVGATVGWAWFSRRTDNLTAGTTAVSYLVLVLGPAKL